MRIRPVISCCGLLLVTYGTVFGSDRQLAVWDGDSRIHQTAKVTAEGVSVHDLLRLMTRESGVALTAAGEVGDKKVVIFGPPRPLFSLLDDVAALFNETWVRQNTSEGAIRYRLEQGASSLQNATQLRRAGVTRMLDQLEEQVQALKETSEQLGRRPDTDPVRRRLQDTRSGSRTATTIYSWLPRDQQEQLIVRRRLQMPFRSLASDRQIVVQNAFDETIRRQYQEASNRIVEGSGLYAPISQSEDLEHYGVTFELHQQGGYTAAWVRLGNRGNLFLAYLGDLQGFSLPTHGNPYTGTAVPARASLPSAGAITRLAEDIPWVDRLRKLSETGNIPVLADYYRSAPVSRPPASPVAATASSPTIEAMDRFCERDSCLWWVRGESLLLRKRDWFTQELREVPDDWMLAMISHLKAQGGIPTYPDLLGLRQLSLSQITGLNSLPGQRNVDELFFVGLPDLLEIVENAPQAQRGLLPVGDIPEASGESLQKYVFLVQDHLAPRQLAPFGRLLAAQDWPVPPEALGGNLKVRAFCRTPKPEVAARGYRYVDLGIRWELHRAYSPTLGRVYSAGYDLYFPMSLADDRRDQTRVELVP